MRALNNPFCAVCSQVINATLTPHSRPRASSRTSRTTSSRAGEDREAREVREAGEIEARGVREAGEDREAREDRAQGLKPEIEVQKLEIELPKLDEIGGLIDPGDIVQRLDDLEGQVKRLEHFITQAQRPDLARGALTAETDVAARNDAPESRPKSRKREK